MNKFNVYIITSWKDWDVAKRNVPSIIKNIAADKVYIVTSDKIKDEVEQMPGCYFLDENQVYPGLSFTAVKDYLAKHKYIVDNTGWYLQQFIKLSIGLIVEDDYYLVWDADTMPMRKIVFFDKNNKPYFNLKNEYFIEYFRAIRNLFGIEKVTPESFISEHMLFNKSVISEMISKIDNNPKLEGDNFWQRILYASALKEPGFLKMDQRYFSEFETYGTYIDHFYPDMYAKRKLVTLRNGVGFFGSDLSPEVYEWVAKDFDTASFEKWAIPMKEYLPLVQDEKYRNKHTAIQYAKHVYKTKKRKAYIAMLKRDFKTVDEYALFRGLLMMDVVFNKKTFAIKEKNIFVKGLRFIKSRISKLLGYGM